MKYYRPLLMLLCVTALQNIHSQTIPTLAEQVTFFRSGVQVERTAEANIQVGVHHYIFKGFSSNLHPASLQVSGEGNFTILAVANKTNYFDSVSYSPEYVQLEKTLKQMNRSRDEVHIYYSSFKSEEELILKQQSLKGPTNEFSVEALIKLADLYRTRLVEIRKKINEYQYQLVQLDSQIDQTKKQMDELLIKNQNHQGTAEIIVSIESKQTQMGHFRFTYYVAEAGWNSSYDLRVKDINSPIQLKSKAEVWQNSHEDWKGVNVKLSTGDPNRSFHIPELDPWWIQMYNPIAYENVKYKYDAQSEGMAPANTRSQVRVPSADMETIVKEQLTVLEFSLPEKWNLESTQNTKTMVIQSQDVQASYQYVAIPKKSTYAFLKAQLSDWESLNLTAGPANIYFKNTLIGTSLLNPSTIEDTLTISLGPDIAVQASRKKSKDLSKKIFLSDKKQQWMAWDIEIKNNKPDNIQLLFEDQIPLSNQASVEVFTEELSGGVLDKETGIVRWTEEIKPGKSVKKRLVYSVRFSKDLKPLLD